MNSYNHYAFGSVMAWVYRRAAGIDADVHAPGFHHIVMHPHADASLPHVHAEYDSAFGTVLSDWTQASGGNFQLKVHVPPNTTATVYLPATAASAITEDGRPLNARYEDGSKIAEVGSGTYEFTVRGQ